MTNNKKRFNSGFSLWETKFTTRYGIEKTELTIYVNRVFRNFLACCYNRGFSHKAFLEKLFNEHGVKISIGRVRELAGVGRFAGRVYSGYINFEWIFAISSFCGYDLPTMMTIDLKAEDHIKENVMRFWAGDKKGVRAGGADLTKYSHPEAINYARR